MLELYLISFSSIELKFVPFSFFSFIEFLNDSPGITSDNAIGLRALSFSSKKSSSKMFFLK